METFVDIILFACQCFFWYMLFSWLARKVLGRVEDQLIAEREELVKKVNNLIHRIKQEKHGDCYYWFDADNDQFLAQGFTDEEIRKHLLSRFKGHIFLINDEKAMAGPNLEIMPVSKLTAKS